jgi:hypothetical protein
MMEAVQRAFEGNSLQVDIVGYGGSLHQGANEIVSDPMHRQLFENHLGGEAAQDIHAQHRFDLSEVQFDVAPSRDHPRTPALAFTATQ